MDKQYETGNFRFWTETEIDLIKRCLHDIKDIDETFFDVNYVRIKLSQIEQRLTILLEGKADKNE